MIVDNTYPDIRVEREARALVEAGHHVDVICMREGADEPRVAWEDGVRVHRLPVRRQRGMGLSVQLREYSVFAAWAAARLAQLHLRHRYDVVQVHNVPDYLVFAALPASLTGTPVILDLHDLMPEFFASRFGGNLDTLPVRLVRWQEWLSTRFATHVLTVTDLWRGILIHRGLPPDKVDVVMNLPDEGLFGMREPEVREAPAPLSIIYHGTLTRRYGVDLLVEAIDRVRRQQPVRLVLHGRGELLPELEEMVRARDLVGVVELSTKWGPTSALKGLILEADIGVVPNRRDVFTDGILPTKLMEYAALGIPAIVARSSATMAYFDDEMVHYVPPGDADALAGAIVELGRDPGRRRKLALRAQSFTATHRWPEEARRYVHLVEQLAARGTRARENQSGKVA